MIRLVTKKVEYPRNDRCVQHGFVHLGVNECGVYEGKLCICIGEHITQATILALDFEPRQAYEECVFTDWEAANKWFSECEKELSR